MSVGLKLAVGTPEGTKVVLSVGKALGAKVGVGDPLGTKVPAVGTPLGAKDRVGKLLGDKVGLSTIASLAV